jgi:integrase
MTRRGHHEGSIYKRSDGRWAATIHLGYWSGKRHRKTFYGDTRREVQEQLTKALRAQQQGETLASDRLTVGAYLDRWLQESARPAIRSKTYHGYAQIVRLYLKPELGRIVLSKLEPHDVQAMLNRLFERGLSARTVSHVHARLRGALNQAVKWGMVPRNVAALVDPPRVPQSEVTPLDPQQARRLLEVLEGERLQALFAVPLAAGLRPGEALGLRWQDVNFEAGTINIFQEVQRLEGKLRLQELKTRRSRRTISLPNSVLDLLRAHQARQQEARTLLGPEWKETGLVFTTWFGTALEPRNVVRSFKRILQKAGLPDIRFYDLRHTCASLLLAQCVHPRVVMEILGHSQISLTMNTYSHVIPQLQQEAASKLDALLRE